MEAPAPSYEDSHYSQGSYERSAHGQVGIGDDTIHEVDNLLQHEAAAGPRTRAASWSTKPTFDVVAAGDDHDQHWNFAQNAPVHTPIWLKRRTLWCFTALFLLCIAALVALHEASKSENGFYIPETASHYGWTYGPTAFLVVVANAWRQVEFHCRLEAPWRALKRSRDGRFDALRTEYISPMIHQVLAMALQRREWHILVAVTGLFLLQIVTVLSTGLLVLQATTGVDSIPVTTQTFDGSLFDKALSNYVKTQNLFDLTGNQMEGYLPSSYMYQLYANWTQNASLPFGITHSLAYSPFNSLEQLPPVTPTTLGSTVDAFIPSVDCQLLDVKVNSTIGYYDDTSHYNFDLFWVSATINGGFCSEWPELHFKIPDPRTVTEDTRIFGSLRNPFQCQEDKDNKTAIINSWSYLNAVAEPQYNQSLNLIDPEGLVFVVGDIRINKATGPSNQSLSTIKISTSLGDADASITVPELNVMVCKPSMELAKVEVRATYQQNYTTPVNITVGVPSKDGSTSGDVLGSDDLSKIFQVAFEQTATMFNDGDTGWVDGTTGSLNVNITGGSTLAIGDTWFSIMILAQKSDSIEAFFDPETFLSAASKGYSAFMSGFAVQNLLSNSTTAADGEVSYPAHGLFVNEVVFWIMISIFILLVLISIYLALTVKASFMAAEPLSLSCIAAVLACDRSLRDLLRGGGHLDDQELDSLLHQRCQDAQFEHETLPTDHADIQTYSAQHGHVLRNWWLPTALQTWFLAITGTLSIGLIVALEVVQRRSDANQGFVSAHEGQTAQLLMRFVPTTVMVIFGGLISSIRTPILTFAPFAALRNGRAPFRVLLRDLLSKSSPHSLYLSIRMGYWGAVFSSVAVLSGAFLAVAASGLYVLQEVSYEVQGLASRTDTFALDFGESLVQDNETGVTMSLMEREGMAYPRNTYDELVFPNLTGQADTVTNFDAPLSVRIPAIRANLDCCVLPPERVLTTCVALAPNSSAGFSFRTSILIPNTCQNGQLVDVPGAKSSEWGLNGDVVPESGKYKGLVRFRTDAGLIFASGFASCSWPWPTPEYQNDDEYNTTDAQKANMTVLTCNQQFQQVDAEVNYLDNELIGIDASQPPLAIEDTAHLLANASNSTSFPFDFNTGLEAGFRAYAPAVNDTGFALDSFFQMILKSAAGSPGRPWEPLVGAENEQHLIETINHEYRRYMAQASNTAARQACVSGDPTCGQAFDVAGTVKGWRVRQEAPSKLALQCLLGGITLCSLLAVITTRHRDVLPHSPYSLAGGMSLLAESQLSTWTGTDSSEDGEEWAGLVRRKMKSMFGGDDATFTMQTWMGRNGAYFGIDLDETKDEYENRIRGMGQQK